MAPNLARKDIAVICYDAIVVEDTDLFADAYPNVILVPLTEDAAFAVAALSTVIAPLPNPGNPVYTALP